MSIDTPVAVREDLVPTVLTDHERVQTRTTAAELAQVEPGLIDAKPWVDAARRFSERLPLAIRESTRRFRRDPGRHGVLLLRNLPTFGHELPPTPTVFDSVQREASKPAGVLSLVMLQLAELIAFEAEKLGALVQDVVPVPGKEEFQGNAGSTTLTMHVENAFHPHRPDYVALLCLRNDHDNVAGLHTACVRRAIELLPGHVLDTLNQERFVTEAPASFGDSAGATVPHAVLEGSVHDPNVRIDFTSTFPLDDDAAAAMAELGEALRRVRHTAILEPGDLAIVDNRITLHGRTAFTPRYDGRDRWLQRAFGQLDVRRSRPMRASDGNVLG